MVTLKSEVNSVRFARSTLNGILMDMELYHGLSLNASIDYFNRRIDREGLTFVTKVLPSLGKAIQRSLETQELVLPPDFRSYCKARRRFGYPAFLHNIFSLVYDVNGRLRRRPSKVAIQDLIQFCFLYYKLELPFEPDILEEEFSSFKKTDSECLQFDDIPNIDKGLWYLAKQELHSLLSGMSLDNLLPRHGPGVTADGLKMWGKFKGTYPDEASHLYPVHENLFVNKEHFRLATKVWKNSNVSPHFRNNFLNPYPELKSYGASIRFVPKDSRGPRLISCEPALMQFLQQGLMSRLYDYVESHPRTSGHVNFTDQTINGNLVIDSSISRRYATLDMKEASDRVSLAHLSLFPEPLRSHLLVLRSRHTEYNGKGVTMTKYAPMGSALCFPVEALVFWAILVASQRRRSIDYAEIYKHTYVYGDDIIIPKRHFDAAIADLESCGLLVNKDKSFSKGFFRESCGEDYFYGHRVTPTRIKKIPSHWGKAPRYVKDNILCYKSLLEVSDNFFKKGYWNAARAIDNWCTPRVGVTTARPEHGLVARTQWFTNCVLFPSFGRCSLLHGLQTYCYVLKQPTPKRAAANDHLGYLQWFLTGSGDEKRPRGHIIVSRRRVTVT